jgi:hypothetical protein
MEPADDKNKQSQQQDQGQRKPAVEPAPAPAPAAAPPSAPTITANELEELKQNLNTPGFQRTSELNARASELANKPGVMPRLKSKWDSINMSGLAEKTNTIKPYMSYNKLYNKLLKEFYKTNK